MKKNKCAVFSLSLSLILASSVVGIASCTGTANEGEINNMAVVDSSGAGTDTTLNTGSMSTSKETVYEGRKQDPTGVDTINTVANSNASNSLANIKTGKTLKKGKVSVIASEADKNNSVMVMDKDGFYKNTEVLPAFPGGEKALERFFENNIKYPEQASENDAQGIVKLSFSVDENGKVYQPLAVGDKVGYGIEDEAIRVFNKMPKWTPGKIKGKNVKTRYTLPIRFELN